MCGCLTAPLNEVIDKLLWVYYSSCKSDMLITALHPIIQLKGLDIESDEETSSVRNRNDPPMYIDVWEELPDLKVNWSPICPHI